MSSIAKLWLVGIAMIFMLSCKSGVEKEVISVDLKSEVLLRNTDIYMKYPYKIKVQDSILCVWDLHGAEKFYHIYSYPNLNFITSFGVKGRGDKEFVNTGGFILDKTNIYVFDSHRAKLYIYTLDSLLHQCDSPAKIVNYPKECIPVLSFAKLDDGFALLNFNGKERVIFVDTLGAIIEKKYDYPIDINVESKKYRNYMASLWDSFIDYNVKSKILGIVTKLGDVVEIHDLANDTSKIIVGKGGVPGLLKKGRTVSIGKIEGFFDIQVKEKVIYALYSGMDREIIVKQLAEGKHTVDGGNFIYEYNLEGQLQRIYKLDQYINGFDIHEDEGVIYTVSSCDDNSICKYKIPTI